jgi:hypothetical protein
VSSAPIRRMQVEIERAQAVVAAVASSMLRSGAPAASEDRLS